MLSGRQAAWIRIRVQNTHEKRARLSDAQLYLIVGTVNAHLPSTINTRLPPNVTSRTTLMVLRDTHSLLGDVVKPNAYTLKGSPSPLKWPWCAQWNLA